MMARLTNPRPGSLAALRGRLANLQKALDRRARVLRSRHQRVAGVPQTDDQFLRAIQTDRQILRAAGAADRAAAQIDRRKLRGLAGGRRNPVSRERALSRLEKLHQAVSRGLHRKKGPPSRRQLAIERAYHRALGTYEYSKRRNPTMAKRKKVRKRAARASGASTKRQAAFDFERTGVKRGHRRGPKGTQSRAKARRTRQRRQHDAHVREPMLYQQDAHVGSYRSSQADKAYRRHLAAVRAARTRRKKKRTAAPAPAKRKRKKAASSRATTTTRKASSRKRTTTTRKASSRKRSGRRITAALRKKMRAGLRKYWARQKKLGGAKARRLRKIGAAIKAYPPLSKAEKAFRRQNPRGRRRRRNPAALLVNPRKKSRRRNPAMKRRRRRNPGLGGVAMEIAMVAGPAVGAGAALGMLDAAIGSSKAPEILQKHAKLASILARVGVGVGALVLLKNKPKYAIPIACAAFAGIGQDLGRKVAGGVAGGSMGMVAKEMSQLAAEDEEAFGLVLNEMSGMGLLAIQGFAGPNEDAAAVFDGVEPLETEF